MTSAAVALAALYAMWVLFLASMTLIRARQAGTMTRTASILGTPIILITVIIDVVINLTIGTLLFLERPQEPTLSQRLGRLCRTGNWRGKLACWICTQLLDQFDPSGQHCKH
jgi:hypothetical protein